jgi:hypothetical protein
LNLPQAYKKGNAVKASGFQAIINNLFWDNGYTQVISGPTRGDAVLDIHRLRLECSLISSNILPGISEHIGVLLETEWNEICQVSKVETIIPLCHKTDILALQASLRDMFILWARNGSCVEEVWKKFKVKILEGFERYVPQEILSKNPDPEYYKRDVSL